MRRLVWCLTLVVALAAATTTLPTTAVADTADIVVQPIGAVPTPDGPAPNWIVADMDTGRVLAAQNENMRTPPASTIKVLLALVVLDELPLDATVVADNGADSHVECNCVGVEAGRTYTARQLLDGLLLVSGNDAANTLAHLLGGADVAVAKMNAKAASIGAVDSRAARRASMVPASTATPPRGTSRSSSAPRWPIRCSRRSPRSRRRCFPATPATSSSSTRTSC